MGEDERSEIRDHCTSARTTDAAASPRASLSPKILVRAPPRLGDRLPSLCMAELSGGGWSATLCVAELSGGGWSGTLCMAELSGGGRNATLRMAELSSGHWSCSSFHFARNPFGPSVISGWPPDCLLRGNASFLKPYAALLRLWRYAFFVNHVQVHKTFV
eukprot:362535-Chlamydomonas_euryale.AAC.6